MPMSPKWSSNIRFHVSSLFRFVTPYILFGNMTPCSLSVQVCDDVYSVQEYDAVYSVSSGLWGCVVCMFRILTLCILSRFVTLCSLFRFVTLRILFRNMTPCSLSLQVCVPNFNINKNIVIKESQV